MTIFKRFAAFFFLMGFIAPADAYVFDNRWFPLYPWTYWRTCDKPSIGIMAPFIMTAHSAAADDDELMGIPEVWGKYDLNKLANGIVQLGRPHPFIGTPFVAFIGRDIPYRLDGKIQAQGIGLALEQSLTDHLWFGASLYAMHVFSRIHFFLADNTLGLTSEQITQLDALRRSMQASLNLEAPKYNRSGLSDIDFYVRLGAIWDYPYKFKRIDAGLRIGALVPTGVIRDINNPASIPFGGNGHWGIYGALDLELELKEDLKVGSFVYISNRFAKTKRERLPLADEHPLFAAFVGDARINPGLTFVFSPYVRLEDIRDGLGVEVKYTLAAHFDDLFQDVRLNPRVPDTRLSSLNDISDWTAEYLTLNAFYDFSRVKVEDCHAPELSLMWDIPIQLALVERACKTHRISLGIKFRY